jgi:hypothetical protein
MKKLLVALAAVSLLSLGAGQAFARPSTHHSVATVRVVMHDPGCHWFAVGTSFQKSLTVAGPVKLVNWDEATLIVKSAHGTVYAKVGKTIALGHGTYAITMVKQAPDDNHLKLVVR